MTDRQSEIAVYAKEYRSERYGMGRSRQVDMRRLVTALSRQGGSLLDVSTGRGETLRFAEQMGLSPVRGTEVVPALLDGDRIVYAEAHSLPFNDGQFDHVMMLDVLEHLIDEDIRPALQELRRVAARTVTVSASCRPSVFGGRDLHISARPLAAWDALISAELGEGTRRAGMAGGSPCWQWTNPA